MFEFRIRFGETVATEFADIFLKAVEEKHLTYDKFDAKKKMIGEEIGNILNPQFEQNWVFSF